MKRESMTKLSTNEHRSIIKEERSFFFVFFELNIARQTIYMKIHLYETLHGKMSSVNVRTAKDHGSLYASRSLITALAVRL